MWRGGYFGAAGGRTGAGGQGAGRRKKHVEPKRASRRFTLAEVEAARLRLQRLDAARKREADAAVAKLAAETAALLAARAKQRRRIAIALAVVGAIS